MQSLDFKGILLTWFYYNSITGAVAPYKTEYFPVSNVKSCLIHSLCLTKGLAAFPDFYHDIPSL